MDSDADRIEQERYAILGGPSSPPPDAVRGAHEALNPPKPSDRIPTDVLAKLEELERQASIPPFVVTTWPGEEDTKDGRHIYVNRPGDKAHDRKHVASWMVEADAELFTMLRNHAGLLIAAAKREAQTARELAEAVKLLEAFQPRPGSPVAAFVERHK